LREFLNNAKPPPPPPKIDKTHVCVSKLWENLSWIMRGPQERILASYVTALYSTWSRSREASNFNRKMQFWYHYFIPIEHDMQKKNFEDSRLPSDINTRKLGCRKYCERERERERERRNAHCNRLVPGGIHLLHSLFLSIHVNPRWSDFDTLLKVSACHNFFHMALADQVNLNFEVLSKKFWENVVITNFQKLLLHKLYSYLL
jgi:hypothetical protein